MSHEDASNIGEMKDGEYALRGVPLSLLILESDPASAAWLAWTGTPANADQLAIIRACIVASTDHGIEPPSAQAARLVASCGKPLADAVAAGLLTLGSRHGNAGGDAARWMMDAVQKKQSAEEAVTKALAQEVKISGFGHPVYTVDPRATALYTIVRKHLPRHPHWDFALEAAQSLSAQKNKPVPLNVDGAIGACVADLGIAPEIADAIFILGRCTGLIAHAMEQAASSSRYIR